MKEPATEPEWAQKVRDNKPEGSPMGPPPFSIPEETARKLNGDNPFVQLTLRFHGSYNGPTKGRVMERRGEGFDFLTCSGEVYFVPWSNLAFWTYLSEV